MSKPPKDRKKGTYSEYLKYSGMAFEMFIIIFLGTLAGRQLDKKMGNQNPIFLLIGLALALILAFYRIMKSLENDSIN